MMSWIYGIPQSPLIIFTVFLLIPYFSADCTSQLMRNDALWFLNHISQVTDLPVYYSELQRSAKRIVRGGTFKIVLSFFPISVLVISTSDRLLLPALNSCTLSERNVCSAQYAFFTRGNKIVTYPTRRD